MPTTTATDPARSGSPPPIADPTGPRGRVSALLSSRLLLWGASCVAAVLAAVPTIRILFTEGANVVSGDEARPLLQFIDPALQGQFNWSELYDASYQNSSSHLLTYLVYFAVARWFEMDYRVLIVLGLTLAVLRIGLLMLLARELLGSRSPVLFALLPALAALSFSKTNISNYEFGFIAFPFGLVTCAFIFGLWAIVRWGRSWRMLASVCITGAVISLASGLGPVTWTVYGIILLALRLLRWRFVVPVVAALLVSASPYYRSLFQTGSYRSELAGEPFSLDLFLSIVGLPLASVWERQIAGGAVVLAATILVILPLLLRPRDAWPWRRLSAPLGLIAAGLLMALLLTVLRGFVVWYYVFTGTLVLFGIAIIAAYHLHRALRRPRNVGTTVGLVCALLTVTVVTGSWASANEDHLAKTVFMRWRSPVTESCLRNYSVAPTTCEPHMAPWAPGSIPYFAGLTRRLGSTLESHGLHPFSRHETWRLQGDWMLDTVETTEDQIDVSWVTPGDAYGTDFTDHRRLDLLTPAPSEVRWTIDVAAGARATFRTAVRMHPAVTDGDGAEAEVLLSTGSDAADVVWHGPANVGVSDWTPVRVPLDRFAGERLTVTLRTTERRTPDFDTVLWRHPVVEVESNRFVDPEPAQRVPTDSLDLAIEDPSVWNASNIRWTGRRHGDARELRLSGGADASDLEPGSTSPETPTGTLARDVSSRPCLDRFTHLAVDMRLEDPWGTRAQGEYGLPREATFRLRVRPREAGSAPREIVLRLPYDLREPEHEPAVQTYRVPLRVIGIPRGARLEHVDVSPISIPVPTSSNIASIGRMQLTRYGSTAAPTCGASYTANEGAS